MSDDLDWTTGMGSWAREISQTLGRIDGKLDSLHDNFKQHVEDDEAVEARVGAVERRQASQRGASHAWAAAAAAAGTILGAVAGYFQKFLFHAN